MARPLRIEYPGAFYHVYSRGLERREIFRDQKDYEKFLRILSEIQKKSSFLCHSYCLMPNHYHLYLETPGIGLSKIMQEISGRYTQSYNRRYKRVGPLFQGRYKAKLIDRDSYSMQLSRYIHLNPVKAKLSVRPEGWRWSSYAAFVGKAGKDLFLETGWLLKQVGGRKEFERFTLNGSKDFWDPLASSGRGPVLGSEGFVEKIKAHLGKREKDSSLTGLRELKKDERVKEVERCIKGFECDERVRNKLLLYALRRYTGLSLKEVGGKVGGMKPIAVSQAVRRIALEGQRDKKTASWIRKLECQM